MKKISILGAGTWGIALARMLAVNGHQVTVWSALPAEIDALATERRHPNLPEMVIPQEIQFTKEIARACEGRDLLVFAVPSVFVRRTAESARPYIPDGQIVADVAKGLEPETLLTMTGIIRDVLSDGQHDRVKLVALSGPTHAEEVAQDMMTSIVSACEDEEAARFVQDVFMNTCMRAYTNEDVLGVELCGALKNIVALAVGISTGLGMGDNARAALITRGMVEINRLGMAMGCTEQTFSGLAGIGDLIVTATSRHSRNNRCGQLIGQGVTPAEAVKQVGMVVEGINAIPGALKLARRYGVEVPIIAATDAIVNGGADPMDVSRTLMTRVRKPEYSRPETEKEPDGQRVLVYGMFDRMDWQTMRLLRRAAALGDRLFVGCMEDAPGICAIQPYAERRAALEQLRCVSRVIPVREKDQLLSDLNEYGITTLAVTAAVSDILPLPEDCDVETIRLEERA